MAPGGRRAGQRRVPILQRLAACQRWPARGCGALAAEERGTTLPAGARRAGRDLRHRVHGRGAPCSLAAGELGGISADDVGGQKVGAYEDHMRKPQEVDAE